MHLRWHSTLLLSWCLAGHATAQQMSWDIPHRGAHVFTRTTQRFDVLPPPSGLITIAAIADGKSDDAHRWRCLTTPLQSLPAGFEQPGFDDSSWPVAQGGFGTDVDSNPNQRTAWRNEIVCLRTTAHLGSKRPKALLFRIDHDDGVRIWLNGNLVVADDGYGTNRYYAVCDPELTAWQRGENLIAVRCTNTGGAQYLDVSLSYLPSLPRGIRTGDDLFAALREETEAANRVRRELFGGYRAPAMLLQGELDGNRKFVPQTPADLRELAWWLAVDLRPGTFGGSIDLDATRMFRLGDLRLRGRASTVGSDGWQDLVLTVKNTKEPQAGSDSNRYVDRFVKPYVMYGFDGTLTVRRRIVSTASGVRVVAFESKLAGSIQNGKDFKQPAAELRHEETWQLGKTHDNQDTAFRGMVQAAIELGCKRLRAQLNNLDAPLLKAEAPNANRSYHTGRIAIGLLALLKGGIDRQDEVVGKALAALRTRRIIDTYSLANAIMAIETLYAPASEVSQLRDGTLDRPRPRQPSAADRLLLQNWVDVLLGNVDTRVDRERVLRFHYLAGNDFDNSTHQYGLLGLWSAHLCGIKIEAIVWQAAAEHLLASQSDRGGKLALELVDYRTIARRRADLPVSGTKGTLFAYQNGWGYKGARDGGEHTPVWGSMTCAGITGLAICQAALQDDPDQKHNRVLKELTRARHDGFAWLAANLTTRHHPGAIERQRRWLYYYLYSLERAALLSGIARIQDRDWYFEGAMMLVLAQQPDGDWPGELNADESIERNAMAILFLKQSTSPVLTGR